MRFNSVGFALSVGMLLIVVLIGFTLLSAAGLVGFAADDVEAARIEISSNEGPAYPVEKVSTSRNVFSGVQAAEVAAGDALFKSNCAQCHAVNEQVVGPALAGITKRRPMSWILPWVKNSSKVVASGDEYAVAIFTKFNKQQMPSFALSDKEITSIVAYINAQQETPMAVATAY
ncbi:c-type cytochrome [Hymenobacter rubidus]|uniref:c-type cytochrome n=1 Tax=Hymenobacter rubidus TaxID=1441626 RepID=UPI001F2E0874|nr:cytochrome c [Hymenobacter rubidus]